jgi:hypothetical protein
MRLIIILAPFFHKRRPFESSLPSLRLALVVVEVAVEQLAQLVGHWNRSKICTLAVRLGEQVLAAAVAAVRIYQIVRVYRQR